VTSFIKLYFTTLTTFVMEHNSFFAMKTITHSVHNSFARRVSVSRVNIDMKRRQAKRTVIATTRRKWFYFFAADKACKSFINVCEFTFVHESLLTQKPIIPDKKKKRNTMRIEISEVLIFDLFSGVYLDFFFLFLF
jgi:hypothetical protein